MWLRLVRALPWRMIITNAPKLVDTARTLYETRRRTASPPEFRGSARSRDTRQLEDMAGAIELMRRRLALALTASVVASGLALLFAIVAFART